MAAQPLGRRRRLQPLKGVWFERLPVSFSVTNLQREMVISAGGWCASHERGINTLDGEYCSKGEGRTGKIEKKRERTFLKLDTPKAVK
jgi:hypothetical protein